MENKTILRSGLVLSSSFFFFFTCQVDFPVIMLPDTNQINEIMGHLWFLIFVSPETNHRGHLFEHGICRSSLMEDTGFYTRR